MLCACLARNGRKCFHVIDNLQDKEMLGKARALIWHVQIRHEKHTFALVFKMAMISSSTYCRVRMMTSLSNRSTGMPWGDIMSVPRICREQNDLNFMLRKMVYLGACRRHRVHCICTGQTDTELCAAQKPVLQHSVTTYLNVSYITIIMVMIMITHATNNVINDDWERDAFCASLWSTRAHLPMRICHVDIGRHLWQATCNDTASIWLAQDQNWCQTAIQ